MLFLNGREGRWCGVASLLFCIYQSFFSRARCHESSLSTDGAVESWAGSGRMLTGLAGVRGAAAAAITRPTWRYTLLELSCASETQPASTANPWQPNGKSILLWESYSVSHRSKLTEQRVNGMSCFQISSFPDNLVDDDPQKALEVNMSSG